MSSMLMVSTALLPSPFWITAEMSSESYPTLSCVYIVVPFPDTVLGDAKSPTLPDHSPGYDITIFTDSIDEFPKRSEPVDELIAALAAKIIIKIATAIIPKYVSLFPLVVDLMIGVANTSGTCNLMV